MNAIPDSAIIKVTCNGVLSVFMIADSGFFSAAITLEQLYHKYSSPNPEFSLNLNSFRQLIPTSPNLQLPLKIFNYLLCMHNIFFYL